MSVSDYTAVRERLVILEEILTLSTVSFPSLIRKFLVSSLLWGMHRKLSFMSKIL